jgi:RNA polymerase sigma factor (sigma-70 family)
MAGQVLSVPRSLGALFDIGVVGDLPDGQLLDRFTASHREAAELAFHALVERHGPMVLRVCRRLLDDPNDAEDAFQATFLVLLRRAGSIRDRSSVAAWLHGVAHRLASRARVESARRRRIERQGVRQSLERNDGPDRLDLGSLIEAEVARLPEKYREPIVLCYLEGLTHEGAADRLGWPVGTVRGRLARARDLLRSRLTRRGVTASAALAAVGSLDASARVAVPTALREATVRAAVEVASGRTIVAVVSAQVAALVERASGHLGFVRGVTLAGALILVGTVGTGLMMFAAPRSPRQPQQAEPAAAPDARETIRREQLQLKGTWTTMAPIESTVDGLPQPPRKVKMTWSIDRDAITEANEDGFADRTYRFSLDPEQSPKTIDLITLNDGLKLYGVYQLEGDTLTVCEGLERPKRFEEGPAQFLSVFRRESRDPAKLVSRFPNAEGCYWAIEPMSHLGWPTSMTTGGINLIIKKDPDGAILVILASMSRRVDGEPDAEYRPVALDGDNKRYLFKAIEGGWGGSAAFPDVILCHQEFRLDPAVLPDDRVKHVGIEVVPAETRRAAKAVAASHALREARAGGIEILPRPEVGKPFAFSLTDTKGRVIRSTDLKGKVVLVDCWAGWCNPSMAKMPRLKAVYERRHADGFEVIGVNFDKDRARADKLVKTLGLPWAEVYVPNDDRTRSLWADGPGISGLPRVFLIDREGILRWQGKPEGLEERIDAMLKSG